MLNPASKAITDLPHFASGEMTLTDEVFSKIWDEETTRIPLVFENISI